LLRLNPKYAKRLETKKPLSLMIQLGIFNAKHLLGLTGGVCKLKKHIHCDILFHNYLPFWFTINELQNIDQIEQRFNDLQNKFL